MGIKMKDGSFHIYFKDCVHYWIAIITVVEFNNDTFYSQYFVLFENNDDYFPSAIMLLGRTEPSEDELEGERTMALKAATLKVWEHLMKEYDVAKDEFYRECARERNNVTEDQDGWGLRSLYRSGSFTKGLEFVQSNTLCNSLKDYIARVRKADRMTWVPVP
jgi:hypothetical protein